MISNRTLFGDCRQSMRELISQGVRVQCCVTSPPYSYQPNRMPQAGLKPKDLVGMPWRIAFALQEDGWWLRQDIIWSKLVVRLPPKKAGAVLDAMPEIQSGVAGYCWCTHGFVGHNVGDERRR